MKKRNLAVSVAILSMVGTNVTAGECEKNFKQVDVSGKVNTQSYTLALQSGSIDMQLTSVNNGKVLFDQTGVIDGEITDPSGYPVVFLDHDINFGNGVEIETNGDRAEVYGYPGDANVPAVEVISNFLGSKTFKNATGEIIATGLLNIDGVGRNEFDLSGSLCIKP